MLNMPSDVLCLSAGSLKRGQEACCLSTALPDGEHSGHSQAQSLLPPSRFT